MHRAIIACCRRILNAAAINLLRDMMEAPYCGGQPAAVTAAAPVAVVSPQFCAPYVVPLTVTKEPFDLDFTVTDANGAVVLRDKLAVKFFSFYRRRVLLDGAGQPILTMRANEFSRHKWEVFKGDSSNASDLLFTAKKSSIYQLRNDVDISLASNTAEQGCDFKIKHGSYFDRSCDFCLGNSNNMIAQMKKPQLAFFWDGLLGKDVSSVTVFPHVDHVFIVALVVILDEIHREQSRSRRRSQNY